MGVASYGRWEPLSIDEAVALFEPASFRWWVSGGHALELHLDRSWRRHDDTDISILRGDAYRLNEALPGWEIHLAADGVLTSWDGSPLSAGRSENNLWCRLSSDHPWSLDITISDGDEEDWIYRRDPTIRKCWPEAVLTTTNGVPYLAPELQLLFKSKQMRPKDGVDAQVIIPALSSRRQRFLRHLLPTGHPWQDFFDAALS